MTVKQILERLDALDDDERDIFLRALCGMLSGVSQRELMDYQTHHMAAGQPGGFEGYVKGQNVVLRRCIEIETSPFGKDVREALGLEELTLDTVISPKEWD
jgi:hypothetical protein